MGIHGRYQSRRNDLGFCCSECFCCRSVFAVTYHGDFAARTYWENSWLIFESFQTLWTKGLCVLAESNHIDIFTLCS